MMVMDLQEEKQVKLLMIIFHHNFKKALIKEIWQNYKHKKMSKTIYEKFSKMHKKNLKTVVSIIQARELVLFQFSFKEINVLSVTLAILEQCYIELPLNKS